MTRASGPRPSSIPSTSSGAVPSSSVAPAVKAAMAGVSRHSNGASASRRTARERAAIALSGCTMLPWPAVPDASSSAQSTPFSPVATRNACSPEGKVWLNPPTSPIACRQPANNSGCVCVTCCAPTRPPDSSSAKNARTTSRRGRRPEAASRSTTVRTAATMPFMSTAPRPQTYPSSTRPLKGSTAQSPGTAGTVSRWLCTTSGGSAASVPGSRATRLTRRGSGSNHRQVSPAAARTSRTYVAASASPRSGVDVSQRMSRLQCSTTPEPAVSTRRPVSADRARR